MVRAAMVPIHPVDSSPNQAARAFLTAADPKHPATYPPDEVKARLEFVKELGAVSRLYDEVWTQVKAR